MTMFIEMSQSTGMLDALYNITPRDIAQDPFYPKGENRRRDEIWVYHVFRLLNLLKDSKLPKLKDFHDDRGVTTGDLTQTAIGWASLKLHFKTLTGKGWATCISVLMALRALSTDEPLDKNCLLARCKRLKAHAQDHLGDAKSGEKFQACHDFFKQNKIGMLVTQKLEYLQRCVETGRAPELMEEMMTRLPCGPGHRPLQKQDEDEFEALARDILFGDEDNEDEDFGPVHQGTPPGKALTAEAEAETEAGKSPFVNTVTGEAPNPMVGNPFRPPLKPVDEPVSDLGSEPPHDSDVDSDSETGSDDEPPAEEPLKKELPAVPMPTPMPTPMPSFDSHQAKRQRTYYEARRQVSKQLEGAVQKAMAEFLSPNDPEPDEAFDEAEVQAVCFRALQAGRNHIEQEIVKLLSKRLH